MTSRSWRQRGMILAVVLCAVPLAWCNAAFAQDDSNDKAETSTLTVRGEGEIAVPADQLRVSLGVTTEHNKAADAVADNAAAMTKVLTALDRAGIDEDEIETGRFDLRPQYARRPRQPEEGWTPTITGYRVVNTITIKTGRLDEAGAIIDAASKAGSNTIEEIAFELADEHEHRGAAIAEATRNAIQDARVMARAADVQLKRVLHLNLGTAGSQLPGRVRRSAIASMESDPGTPITPGDVTIHANVTIVYEIESIE